MKTSNGKLLGQPKSDSDVFKQQLEKIEQEVSKLQAMEKRLESLEITRLSQIENRLTNLKQQIPTKLLWLTFSSSLIMTTISLGTWLDIYPFHKRSPQTSYSLNRQELIIDKSL
jgi:hypothetical protein